MRNGEWGKVFYLDADYDLSDYDTLSLVFTKPSGDTLTKTPTLGTSDIETDRGTFSANQYVSYTFQDGDVDEAGTWTAQLTYVETGVVKLIGDKASLVITA